MGKKLQKNFRLAPEIAAELSTRSRRSGFDETKIVEDALALYMGRHDPDLLARQTHVLREPEVPYKVSSKPATQGTKAERARQAGTRKPKDVQ
jgi:hypothetical protein